MRRTLHVVTGLLGLLVAASIILNYPWASTDMTTVDRWVVAGIIGFVAIYVLAGSVMRPANNKT